MRRHLFILIGLLFLIPFSTNAREIRGRVLADNDSTAVAAAKCMLFSADKKLLEIPSDADGRFVINTSDKSALTLRITGFGYGESEVLVPQGSGNLNVGNVYLPLGTDLEAVTVTAGKVSYNKGRTIVYPSTAEVKASSTSVSLFQKLPLPGLEADLINRSLSVDGGAPVILINGIPSTMEDVNSLAPKDIEKIEYSRVSPARYADKGTNGFINIRLKVRNDGGNVYFWMRSCPWTGFLDANLRGSYHQGPSQFTFYYTPSWRNYQKVYDTNIESYVSDEFRVDIESHDRNPFNYLGNPLKLKYDFKPSEKTLLSATFTAGIMTNHRSVFADYKDSFLGDYKSYSESRGKNFNPSLDLFFRQKFNDRNSLEVQVVGTILNDRYERSNLYEYSDGSESDYSTDVYNRRRSLISEISYVHDFSDRTTLSAGYQNTISRSTNTYIDEDYKPVLTENNNYAYLSLSQIVGRVTFRLSSGMKIFRMKNDMNTRNFTRNRSQFFMSWNASREWNVQAAFVYSPGIPGLSALTDYPQQTSPYIVSNGNPDLKVADYFSYQASVSYTKKKFFANLFLGFNDNRNAVTTEVSYLGDRRFLTRSENYRKDMSYRAGLTLRLSDLYGFGASLNLSFNRYYTAGRDWSHNLSSFSGSVSVYWSKGPFTVSYWRKLPGKYLGGQYVSKAENGDALSFQFAPGKHWIIGADWMYMFDRKGTRYPSWNLSSTSPRSSERHISNNANMLVLSVTYQADFGSIFRTGRRSLNNSDSGSSLLKL